MNAATAKIRAAIFGASGYSGAELVRGLKPHPFVLIAALGADSAAGQKLEELYPAFKGLDLPPLEKLDPAVLKGRADLAFLALPHTQSMALAPALLEAGLKVIDLSGDFRLKDAGTYEQWYKHPHTAPELLAEAVYGLPELHSERIKKARLVANPGCYTTTAILALHPLLASGKAQPDSVVIDAKSGVTGAGRKLAQAAMFAEVYDNFSAYKAGGVHQHIPEIEQELGGVKVSFTPHLLPLSRGIFATCYAGLKPGFGQAGIEALYKDAYKSAPFVRVYENGELPSLRSVRGTNECHLGLKVDARTSRAIIVSCTDNLGKGAALQAIQNMNLMFGLPEDEGLRHLALPI